MRWLLISSQHHPAHGGIGTYITRFCNAAIQNGWQVDLMTRVSDQVPSGVRGINVQTKDDQPEFADRIPGLRALHRIRPYRYGLWSLAIARKLLSIQPDKYDAVEFVDCQAEGFVSLCSNRVRSRWSAVPMIIHAHTPMFVESEINSEDCNQFGRTIYHDWERRALQHADGIITTSRGLKAKLPSCRSEILVQPYPIAAELSDRECNHRLPMILLIGSAQKRKGVLSWIEGLNIVLKKHATVRAKLIGPDTRGGPNGTSMVAHMKTLLHPDLHQRFEWTGPLSHDRVQSAIASASLVVVPSVFESFSFAAVEALNAGTPVLLSNCVGLTEHVANIPVCKVNDVQSWAERQIEMITNNEMYRGNVPALRDQMLKVCSPASNVAFRSEWITRIKAAQSNYAADAELDAMDEIEQFLREVESAERDACVLSSSIS
jgi:glycosyltransferase involved in cell wall biosynthesis